MYKLLHPFHGVVSLQQRSSCHEAFVAASLILTLIPLLSSSVILFMALGDRLKQDRQTTLDWIHAKIYRHFFER